MLDLLIGLFKSFLMSKVALVYVGNEDVGKHVKSLQTKKKKNAEVVRRKADKLASDFAELSATTEVQTGSKKKRAKEEEKHEEDICATTGAVELMNTDCDMQSTQVYCFKTPKRSKQMAKYAAESVQKSHKKNQVQKQAEENKKESGSKSIPTRKISEGEPLSNNSRYNVRTRNNLNLSDGSSDQEGSGSDQLSSDDEFGTNVPSMEGSQSTTSSSLTPSQRLQLPSHRELYFDAHGGGSSGNASQTSDRTLQRLRNPRMDVNTLSEVLARHQQHAVSDEAKSVSEYTSLLLESHKLYFRKWMFSLCNGFNLLLFGLGSKRNLIHAFCEEMLKSYTKLVVNGFFPGLSIKSILFNIVEEILKLDDVASSSAEAQIEAICDHYSSDSADPLFLILHNIDGITLRSSRTQNILSRLAEVPKIHVIASIDHINAPLIWDQTKLSRFSWLWYDVTTYASYVEETSHEGSLLLTNAGTGVSARGSALALSGLMHVARSLTANARGVFRFLAEHQVADADEERSSEDVSFFDLYQKSRENFLVNSELTLRAHLTEFLDHKLVQIRKGVDGCEYLSVPLDTATLKEYLEQEEFF